MSLEEERAEVDRRGETIKFLVLVVVMLGVVLVVAAARPLIFDRIVPALLGWQEEEEMPSQPAPQLAPQSAPQPTPLPTATPQPALATATATRPTQQNTPVSSTPTTSASPSPPTPSPQLHRVEPGENLTTIAQRYGITVQALIDANNLANPDQLLPGDRLIIP